MCTCTSHHNNHRQSLTRDGEHIIVTRWRDHRNGNARNLIAVFLGALVIPPLRLIDSGDDAFSQGILTGHLWIVEAHVLPDYSLPDKVQLLLVMDSTAIPVVEEPQIPLAIKFWPQSPGEVHGQISSISGILHDAKVPHPLAQIPLGHLSPPHYFGCWWWGFLLSLLVQVSSNVERMFVFPTIDWSRLRMRHSGDWQHRPSCWGCR